MFPVRYLQNTSSAELHLAEDVLPFQWCCVDSFPLGDRYCELYLEKRPLATSENYDQLCPGEYRLTPHGVLGLGYSTLVYGHDTGASVTE